MRTLLPALLTLPSSTVDTFSCLPILRMSSVVPLKTKTDVRAGTRNPLIWDKAVHKSSVSPVAQVIVLFFSAHIDERQHGDSSWWWRRRSALPNHHAHCSCKGE